MPVRATAAPVADDRRIGERSNGLDAWRAALLLMGVVVHGFALGANHDSHIPHLRIPSAFTGLFRMEAFFLIAGLFSMRRAGKEAEWLRNRIAQVGMPFLLGVVAINTATSAIVASATHAPFALGEAVNPRHLWFLQNLFLYALLLAAFKAKLDGVLPWLERRADAELAAGLAGVSWAIAVTGSTALYFSDLPYAVRDAIKLPLIYAPCYAAGYLIGRSPALRDRLAAAARPLGLGSVALICVGLAWNLHDASPDPPHRFASVSIKALVGPFVALGIVAHGLRASHASALAARLSAASFTIYLVHLLFLSAFMWALRTWGLNDVGALVAGSIALTVPAAYLFHHRIVARHAVFGFLFNGDLRDVAPGSAIRSGVSRSGFAHGFRRTLQAAEIRGRDSLIGSPAGFVRRLGSPNRGGALVA